MPIYDSRAVPYWVSQPGLVSSFVRPRYFQCPGLNVKFNNAAQWVGASRLIYPHAHPISSQPHKHTYKRRIQSIFSKWEDNIDCTPLAPTQYILLQRTRRKIQTDKFEADLPLGEPKPPPLSYITHTSNSPFSIHFFLTVFHCQDILSDLLIQWRWICWSYVSIFFIDCPCMYSK